MERDGLATSEPRWAEGDALMAEFSAIWDQEYWSMEDMQTIFAELCMAINNREKIIGRGAYTDSWSPWKEAHDNAQGLGYVGAGISAEALTQWQIGDGNSEKAFPVADDFDHLAHEWCHLADAPPKVNLLRMRAAIEGMHHNAQLQTGGTFFDSRFAAVFVDVSSIDTGRCKATRFDYTDALQAAGLGSDWLLTTNYLWRLQDDRYWRQVKAVLEAMTHVLWMFGFGEPNGEDGLKVGNGEYDKYEDPEFVFSSYGGAYEATPTRHTKEPVAVESFFTPSAIGEKAYEFYTTDDGPIVTTVSWGTEWCTKYLKGSRVAAMPPTVFFRFWNVEEPADFLGANGNTPAPTLWEFSDGTNTWDWEWDGSTWSITDGPTYEEEWDVYGTVDFPDPDLGSSWPTIGSQTAFGGYTRTPSTIPEPYDPPGSFDGGFPYNSVGDAGGHQQIDFMVVWGPYISVDGNSRPIISERCARCITDISGEL